MLLQTAPSSLPSNPKPAFKNEKFATSAFFAKHDMSSHVAKRRKGEHGEHAPKSKPVVEEKKKKVLKIAKAPEPAAHNVKTVRANPALVSSNWRALCSVCALSHYESASRYL